MDKVNDDVININDIVEVKMSFFEEEDETMCFKLINGEIDFKADIQEVSVSSPLGSAVYGKKINDNISYEVNKAKISGTIINKEKPLSRTKIKN